MGLLGLSCWPSVLQRVCVCVCVYVDIHPALHVIESPDNSFESPDKTNRKSMNIIEYVPEQHKQQTKKTKTHKKQIAV